MLVTLKKEPRLLTSSAYDPVLPALLTVVAMMGGFMGLVAALSGMMFGWAVLIVAVAIVLPLAIYSKRSVIEKKEASLIKENKGMLTISEQVGKAYGAKVIAWSGGNAKSVPVQNVIVSFNGHEDRFDGRLYIMDGKANLKIRMNDDLVPAENVSANLAAA